MKLKFFNPANVERNIKATVHKTGKLGFTVEAAKKLSLGIEKSIAIAINEEDENDLNLYGILHPTLQSQAIKVSKAGAYYYLNTKPFFDSINLDYSQGNIVYDIAEEDIEGTPMLKFKRRKLDKRNKKEIEIDNQ